MSNTDNGRRDLNALIRDLLNALDVIERKAGSADPYALPFIRGAAEQAIKNAKSQMVRNADGYLVCAGEL